MKRISWKYGYNQSQWYDSMTIFFTDLLWERRLHYHVFPVWGLSFNDFPRVNARRQRRFSKNDMDSSLLKKVSASKRFASIRIIQRQGTEDRKALRTDGAEGHPSLFKVLNVSTQCSLSFRAHGNSTKTFILKFSTQWTWQWASPWGRQAHKTLCKANEDRRRVWRSVSLYLLLHAT